MPGLRTGLEDAVSAAVGASGCESARARGKEACHRHSPSRGLRTASSRQVLLLDVQKVCVCLGPISSFVWPPTVTINTFL